MVIARRLKPSLPRGQSMFLWGARKTGKSTLLRALFPRSATFDLLDTALFVDLLKTPGLLAERVRALRGPAAREPVVIDEVQKVPALLDEVHRLAEQGFGFVLCGSSARKVRRGHANLLGGRAWRYELFPLVSAEVPDLELLRALNHGLIPKHYLEPDADAIRSLRAYVQDYLKEEIVAEGLVRQAGAFARFLDAIAYTHGELVSYANIARDCGVDAKTVREYCDILVDTLLGVRVEPYKKRQERQVIGKAPKLWLFDVGVAGSLTGRWVAEPRGEAFGRALEHLVLMEVVAWRSYSERPYRLSFWRAKSGLEVDIVLGDGEVAVEVKGTSRVDGSELRGIRAFARDHRPRRCWVVTNEPAARRVDGLELLPWRDFLQRLWDGDVI